MKLRKVFSWWVIGLVFIVPIIACDAVQSMGVLEIGDPQLFEAKGETIQTWRASVMQNTEYEIVIEPEGDNYAYNYNGADVSICKQEGDFCSGDIQLAYVSSRSDGARVVFNSTNADQIWIHVIASLGERGEVTGTYTISLLEAQ